MINYVSKIRTVIVALIVGFIVHLYGQIDRTKSLNENFSTWQIIILIITIAVLLMLIIFEYKINLLIYKLKLKSKNIKSGYIYEKIIDTIEYHDLKGKKVSYNRESYILNLNAANNKQEISFPIFAQKGKLDQKKTKAINSKYNFINPNRLIYEVNLKDSIVSKNRHYASFSTQFLNCFMDDKNKHWIMTGDRYCKFFQFNLIMPTNVANLICKVYQFENPNDKSFVYDDENIPWVEKNESYLIIESINNTKIKVVLAGLEKNISYKIIWDFKSKT